MMIQNEKLRRAFSVRVLRNITVLIIHYIRVKFELKYILLHLNFMI